MDSSTQTDTADDYIKLNSDLFDLAEKLQIELHKRDEELAKEKREKQNLSANFELEKARANLRANQVDGLKTELASAQQTIHVFHMSLWYADVFRKSFPSPDLSYYIKSGSPNGQFCYLYGRSGDYLRSSAGGLSRSEFKITKNYDGTFSIYSMVFLYLKDSLPQPLKRYLQITTNSSRVHFSATDEHNADKFVFHFHRQNQHAGILVQIISLNGHFLCVEVQNKENYVVANSRTQAAGKFLIIPVDVE